MEQGRFEGFVDRVTIGSKVSVFNIESIFEAYRMIKKMSFSFILVFSASAFAEYKDLGRYIGKGQDGEYFEKAPKGPIKTSTKFISCEAGCKEEVGTILRYDKLGRAYYVRRRIEDGFIVDTYVYDGDSKHPSIVKSTYPNGREIEIVYGRDKYGNTREINGKALNVQFDHEDANNQLVYYVNDVSLYESGSITTSVYVGGYVSRILQTVWWPFEDSKATPSYTVTEYNRTLNTKGAVIIKEYKVIENGITQFLSTDTYNEFGDVVKSLLILYKPVNKVISVEKVNYVYDKHSNWVSYKNCQIINSKTSSKKCQLIKRELEYYL